MVPPLAMAFNTLLSVRTFYLILHQLQTSNGYSLITPFYSTLCPPHFNTSDCFGMIPKQWLPNHDSDSLDSTSLVGNEKYHIEGINYILKAFGTSNVLTILTAYHDFIFTEISYPIILRNLRLAWLWYSNGYTWTPYLKNIVLDEVLKRKLYLTTNFPQHYLLNGSPYLANLNSWRYFSVLNISSYSIMSHPWNNLVSIFLLYSLNSTQYIGDTYLNIDHITQKKYRYNIFPSNASPLKVFAVPLLQENDTSQLVKLINYINDATNLYANFYLVTSESMPVEGWLLDSEIFIKTIKSIQICRRKLKIELSFVSMNFSIMTLNEPVGTSLCGGSPGMSNIFYSINTNRNYLTDRIILYLKTFLEGCQEVPQVLHDVEQQETKLVAETYAGVWASILKNYSYISDYNRNLRLCDNGQVVPNVESEVLMTIADIVLHIDPSFIRAEASASLYYAVIPCVFSDLKFVTCGYQGKEGLQFMELFTAFDRNVWLVIIFVLLVLIPVLHKIPCNTSQLTIPQGVLVLAKLLLEQGNPFPDSLLTSHWCKCLSMTLLLTGIVLSNAYKNTNVYNMIRPRLVIPYLHLRELVDDNFQILGRSFNFHVYIEILRHWWDDRNISFSSFSPLKDKAHFKTYSLGFPYPSEIKVPHDAGQESELANFHQIANETDANANNNLTDLLFNVTSILAITATALQNIVNRVKCMNVTTFIEFSLQFSKQFELEEASRFHGILKACKKTAVLMPTYAGYQIISDLEREGQRHAYQGLETYYEMNLVFDLKGVIPPYLAKRARYAERSGLWKRHQDLFKQRYFQKNIEGTESLKKPTMSGNVVVIFLFLAAGLVASVIQFCSEKWLQSIVRVSLWFVMQYSFSASRIKLLKYIFLRLLFGILQIWMALRY